MPEPDLLHHDDCASIPWHIETAEESNASTSSIETAATLSLHGASKSLNVNATAVKIGDQLLVTSNKPVIVNTSDFGLVGGIEALRKIAKLSSIPIAVPDSFTLVFK